MARTFKVARNITMNKLGEERGFHWNYTGRFHWLFCEGDIVQEVEAERPSWIPPNEVYVKPTGEGDGPWWVPAHWLEECS